MYNEIWNIKAKILGNFYLIKDENIKTFSIQYKSIKKVIIEPDLVNDKQSGRFNVDITFEVSNDSTNKVPSHIPADLGRDILMTYLDLLTFISGNPVTLFTSPYLVHKYNGINKYRHLTFSSQEAYLEKPIPLEQTKIFLKQLDKKQCTILSWLRRGLKEKDAINSIISLFIPLELLATLFPIEDKIINKCENCGHEKSSRPGMRLQVENFLIKIIGYDDLQFKAIWETRNSITHGNFNLNSEGIRSINIVKADLVIAIIKGTKMIFELSSSEFPLEVLPKWSFCDAILDIEYT